MQKSLAHGAVVLFTTLVLACRGGDAARAGTGEAGIPGDKPAAAERTPAQALESFLALSIVTRRPTLRSMDSVFAVSWGESDSSDVNETLVDNWEDTRWLADYRILRVAPDTVIEGNFIGTVAITTVAAVVGEVTPVGRATATFGIQEDTVRWRLAKGPLSQGQWKVIGATQTDLLGLGMGPAIVEWKPRGASLEKAFAAVDSIRTARGLPIVR